MRLVGKNRVSVTVDLDRRDWDRLRAYVGRVNDEERGEVISLESVIVAALQVRLDQVEPAAPVKPKGGGT